MIGDGGSFALAISSKLLRVRSAGGGMDEIFGLWSIVHAHLHPVTHRVGVLAVGD